MGEWAGLRHAEGGDDDVDYYTAGLGLTVDEHWNFSASYTARNTESSGGDIDDYMAQASAGYAFDNGLALDIGYKISEETDIESHTLGGVLSYTLEF